MDYPKTVLHLHLDGAMPARLFAKWSREDGMIPEEMSDEAWISAHQLKESMSLAEALANFDILLTLLNREERLSECTEELLEDLYQEGVRVAEIRFSPQSHHPLSMEAAVQAVIAGQKKAVSRHPDLCAGILLCMMHGTDNEAENRNTVLLAGKYLKEGVVGIDLAGNETGNPLSDYESCFILAKENGIPFTIHAGESGPASNVQYAIDLGAKRIGHGVKSISDENVVKNLVSHGVTLEVCPTSNIYASSFPSLKEHPVRKLYDAGVKLNLNTDDPFLMNLTLEQEYQNMRDVFRFTEKELILTNLYGAEASFCKGSEKVAEQLRSILANMK